MATGRRITESENLLDHTSRLSLIVTIIDRWRMNGVGLSGRVFRTLPLLDSSVALLDKYRQRSQTVFASSSSRRSSPADSRQDERTLFRHELPYQGQNLMLDTSKHGRTIALWNDLLKDNETHRDPMDRDRAGPT